MKLGTSFAAYKTTAATGSINMIIESGGVVDATLTTSGVTNAASATSGIGFTGYSWFVTQGTGSLKQVVGSTAVTYPVGPTLTSYNPVTLTNGGGGIFSAAVAPVNSPAGLPNATKAVNRTWGIVPATLPATVDLSFGYNTGEGNASCVLTNSMQLYSNNTATWTGLSSATPTVPSSGATSYQAGFTAVNSFPFFCLVNAAAIPVELTTLKGYAKGKTNIIEWQTATELNNREFAIERSVNGVDFNKIGIVKGNGKSNVVNNYTFADETGPLSISYYRLRQIDFDGRETVSKSITIARDGSSKVHINKLYPSVTSDVLTLDLTTNGLTALTITNLVGRVVKTYSLGDNSGSMIQTLNVSSLASGLYFMTVQSGSTRLTERFEKK